MSAWSRAASTSDRGNQTRNVVKSNIQLRGNSQTVTSINKGKIFLVCVLQIEHTFRIFSNTSLSLNIACKSDEGSIQPNLAHKLQIQNIKVNH